MKPAKFRVGQRVLVTRIRTIGTIREAVWIKYPAAHMNFRWIYTVMLSADRDITCEEEDLVEKVGLSR